MTIGSVYNHKDFIITSEDGKYSFRCRFFKHKNDNEKKFFVCSAIPEKPIDPEEFKNFNENLRITSPYIDDPYTLIREKIALEFEDKIEKIEDIKIYIYDPTKQTAEDFVFLELTEDYITTSFNELHVKDIKDLPKCFELTAEDLNFE